MRVDRDLAVSALAFLGIALLASGAAALDLGNRWALPPILGVGLATGISTERLVRSPTRAAVAAVVATLCAFALDWFVLFVLGAGHPELRTLRGGPVYSGAFVLLFWAPAFSDAKAMTSAS